MGGGATFSTARGKSKVRKFCSMDGNPSALGNILLLGPLGGVHFPTRAISHMKQYLAIVESEPSKR